jgi:hypothetical protein
MRVCACVLARVRRCPYPLPYIYTHAQTFSKGFGVSTSLPHRPLKPPDTKKGPPAFKESPT